MNLETRTSKVSKATKILLPPVVGFILSYLFTHICQLFYPFEPVDESSTPGFVFLMEYIFYLLLILSVLLFQTYYIVPKSVRNGGKGINGLMKKGVVLIALIGIVLIPISINLDKSSLTDGIKVGLFTIAYFGLFWLGNLFTLRTLNNKEFA